MTIGRADIRRLRAGILPMGHIEQLSVGYEAVRPEIYEVLDSFHRKGRAGPLYILGEWGTGKSHMLEYVRAAAVRRGMAHVWIDLNARNAALNFPQRFYPWIAESVSLGPDRGLRSIIERAFGDPERRDALLRYAWADDSGNLGRAIKALILATGRDGQLLSSDEAAWGTVAGTDLAWSDGKRRQALDRLRQVARLIRTLSAGGLVALFDEAETIDQLWNRLSRMGAYDTLGTLCATDGLLAIFGVTHRFDASVSKDLERGMIQYAPTRPASDFLQSWQRKAYLIIHPPAIGDSEADDLARLIVGGYSEAYSDCGGRLQDAKVVLDRWKANPARNPRRLIRALIDWLDGTRPLLKSNAADGATTNEATAASVVAMATSAPSTD